MTTTENKLPNKLIFKNNEIGFEFRLSVVDYQYPECTTGYDANWIILQYECYYGKNSFTIKDPSIVTYNLEGILSWFKEIYENKIENHRRIYFEEPNFSLIFYRKKNNLSKIGIQLEYEPSFEIPDPSDKEVSDDESGLVLQFDLTDQDINGYITQLKEIISQFPFRGKLE